MRGGGGADLPSRAVTRSLSAETLNGSDLFLVAILQKFLGNQDWLEIREETKREELRRAKIFTF